MGAAHIVRSPGRRRGHAREPLSLRSRDDERPLPWGQQRTYIKGGRVGTAPSGGGFTQNQKMLFGLVAVLVGPSLVKKWSEKPASEKVDLSMYKIVTEYKTPAIDKHDSTLRIEFCAS